ncbi:MAG: hypothetical protein FWC77_01855 [Defluviitaleaceae bacterium]|nr:hypothetical protein [Defluviitaleaceae bacterium]
MVDRRGILDEEVFTYRITKDEKVFIYSHGKHVTTLAGKRAIAFIGIIKTAGEKEAQLIMAKATGHFKHGNERVAKQSRKR